MRIFSVSLSLFLAIGVVMTIAVPVRADNVPPSPTIEADLLRFAAEAKAAFRARMDPMVLQLGTRERDPMAQITYRDVTAIAREYAEESYAAAVDALLEEARTPKRGRAVEAALRDLANSGSSGLADPIFKEIADSKAAAGLNRDAAAALRHSVALNELPAALGPLIKRPFDPMPSPPDGARAVPTYLRAAELDPDYPWTWIVLSWRANNSREALDYAISHAEKAAEASGDRRARIVAGLSYTDLGDPVRAEQALTQALTLARAWADEDPASTAAQRYQGIALIRLSQFLVEMQRYDEAAAACREALAVRLRLAEAAPEDIRRQVEVIAAHAWLALVAHQLGDQPARDDELNEAWQMWDALAARDPLKPTIPLNSGTALLALQVAGGLTLIVGLFGVARYRQVLARYMKTVAAVSPVPVPANAPRFESIPLAAELPVRWLDAQKGPSHPPSSRSPTIVGAGRAFNRAGWVHALAGLAFAIVAANLYLRAIAVEDMTWYQLFTQILCWSWPVVLTLALLWGPDRRRLGVLLGLYFLMLLVLCFRAAFSDSDPPVVQGVTVPRFLVPVLMWFLIAGPSLFLLLFLNRRLRAVGPLLFLLLLIISGGGLAALAGLSTYAGTMTFVRTGLDAHFYWVVPVFGALLFLPVGWWAIARAWRWLDANRIGEQRIVFDSIWLFQTLALCSSTVHDAGTEGWLALSAFVAYKLVTWIGLRPLARQAATRTPARLLLLRTFGFRRRSERFFDLLGARWRYAGSIQLIAAPDLAARLIDPGKLLDFFGGRLRHRFIINPEDIDRRLTEIDDRPDPDGRYRVNEFFCGHDTWQPTVRRLMAASEMVAMDLRSFSKTNEGCLYELQSLIDSVPIGKVVLITDRTTDTAHLRQTLADCWANTAPGSPNRTGQGAITVLETGGRDVLAVTRLLAMADDVLAASSVDAHDEVSTLAPHQTASLSAG